LAFERRYSASHSTPSAPINILKSNSESAYNPIPAGERVAGGEFSKCHRLCESLTDNDKVKRKLMCHLESVNFSGDQKYKKAGSILYKLLFLGLITSHLGTSGPFLQACGP
jgi:hypothetical protein